MIDSFHPIEVELNRDGNRRKAVVTPTIHLEELRTVSGECIPGSGNAKLSVHQPDAGPCRYVHRSRHLCPHVHVPVRLLTRDDPAKQEVSVALGKQERDWDLLERHRDLVFTGKGIRATDSAWDKVWALAEDIWTFRREIQKPGGNDFTRSCPWSHPVDTLIYGSWCLGGAYALIGLCATLGIPAREVAMGGHSAAEVLLGGQWCFVDSIARFPKNGGTNMLKAPFAEVRLNPFDRVWSFCEEQRQFYWETDVLSVSSPDNGLWLQQFRRTHLCPQTALALYPGWTDPRFKSHHADRHDLLWGRPGYGGPLDELVLRQGQMFQRRFWLGSLGETAGIIATFYGASNFARDLGVACTRNVPDNGGNWCVIVNGREHALRDGGGWTFDTPKNAAWSFAFDVPVSELRENDWNTIGIGCSGSGGEFLWLGWNAEWSVPAEACRRG